MVEEELPYYAVVGGEDDFIGIVRDWWTECEPLIRHHRQTARWKRFERREEAVAFIESHHSVTAVIRRKVFLQDLQRARRIAGVEQGEEEGSEEREAQQRQAEGAVAPDVRIICRLTNLLIRFLIFVFTVVIDGLERVEHYTRQ